MNSNKLALYVFILILGVVISFFVISSHFSVQSTNLILIAMIFALVLINPDVGLVILIVSIIFSPELVLGETTRRLVLVRIEDVILLVVILAWTLKVALTKDIRATFSTKLTLTFSIYIGICVLSTLISYLFGEIDIYLGLFSILKYAEYFLLFIMVKDRCKTMNLAKVFIFVFIITALMVGVHSNVFIKQEIDAGKEFFRVAPPTNALSGGESGTLGGYTILMMSIIGGLILYSKPLALRIGLICLELILFRTFAYTLSRGSYIAIFPASISLVLFTERWKMQLVYILIAAAVLMMLFTPQMIRDRVASSVTIEEDIKGSYIELEDSPQARLESWKYVIKEKFTKSPILGHGVSGYFVDGQFFLTLYETGLLGLTFFVLILVKLFKMARRIICMEAVKKDDFAMGISVGFLAGFVGLLFHALSTNTFILIKVMEPFWFIAAIVLSFPHILDPEHENKPPQLDFRGFEHTG